MSSKILLQGALLGLAMLAVLDARAGVTAERTRAIIAEGHRETSLLLVNQNAYPVIVQTWIDDGAPNSTPQSARAPIMPLPPVFRLEPGQQRSLRLLRTGQALPGDRESLYWLNLYEIPPQATGLLAEGQSRLTVTLRTQMKVIYRPRPLARGAEEAPHQLRFERRGETLQMENPTPYFISLAGAELGGHTRLAAAELLPPFSRRVLALRQALPGGQAEVRFSWIDDGGNLQQGRSLLH
ncbi:TPA: fimbrial biogenesis chaperone [Pseudomonas aeruginosa]|uniref:Putative pili assembly chaperone n=3 Tax=Pseudomonas aeruginosa TaxID=287 RepID=Q7WY18_PSEAI|nr:MULTISPECIES: molecular chaperone [Pseudomonas]SAJ33191.1 Pili assembly chaperone%2C N-terminal protein [Enterobacter cloacae]AAP84167.1 putative pili assembly chaperone [Pseudomonas aeruginosa PA14]ABJ13885.1 putative pili assembly chaperone [Pseudomonas aeruginosa UCBPP-PA14]ALY72187.2 molecular chaperone [Pseudomonas aeruginosa]EIU3128345.1 molecular chaperone [Pseudomonas aeruginosa]